MYSILDILQNHCNKLWEELEWFRDELPKGDKVDLKTVLESFSTGDFARIMEQIKFCNLYIDLIAGSLGADLRVIGNATEMGLPTIND